MKIYTKSGDKGITSLYNGLRIGKNELIFDVLGELDELRSRIGMLCIFIQQKEIVLFLHKIQGKIKDINSVVSSNNLYEIVDEDINQLEILIDELEKYNGPLNTNILPGVGEADTQSHLCRTQTRKVERFLCKFKNDNSPNINFHANITSYINRLGDFFFVLARWLCKKEGFEECFTN